MEEWQFMQALPQDLNAILGLIRQRIAWMDQKGLEQWNKTDYFSAFPPDYFAQAIREGHIYVLCTKEPRRVIGLISLKEEDSYWPTDNKNCCYMHNLATNAAFPGAGRALLGHCEEQARRWGKEYLRLDCQRDNNKLNQYYENLGFMPVGTVEDAPYYGIRREKKLR